MKSYYRNKIFCFFLSVFGFIFTSCDDGSLNIFTLEDDIEMGREITNEILANPSEYPVLDEYEYPAAYGHLRRIRNDILASGKVRYADRFDWDIYIIDQNVLNAFALPGGNTFYYTGLIKYLDNEASFAGIMAHEFAHCDRRHTTARLTKLYGYQLLLSMLLSYKLGFQGSSLFL